MPVLRDALIRNSDPPTYFVVDPLAQWGMA